LKKYISLILVLGFMAHYPQKLAASFFTIKPNIGISYGGSISDTWTTTSNYFNYRAEKNVDKSFTVNGSFELVFSLFRNFSLSAGGGYISKGMNGTRGVFSFPGTTDLRGDFFATPQYNFKAFFGILSAQWTFPVFRESNVYILGGLGYYFAKFDNNDKHIYYSNRFSDIEVYYFPIAFNGRSNSVGYHAGAGIEVELDSNVFFYFESRYRRVNFKDIDISFDKTGDSTYHTFIRNKLGDEAAESVFIYYLDTGPNKEWGDLVYSINNLLLSEIVLSIGMRIGF
jgi:opacity protein-like surface antigen